MNALPPLATVLVTGATGAIGPQVVQVLAHAGLRVRALVRQPTTQFDHLSNVACVVGDILDSAALDRAAAGCHAVVHMAALLHINNPPPAMHPQFQAANVGGTANVVAAAAAARVQRLVFLSTFAVYGDTHGRPITELSEPHPTTIYGETKLAAEKLVLAANRPDSPPWTVVLRLTSVYGGRVTGNYNRLLNSIARGRFVPIGDSSQRRTLVYDADVAQAILLALQHPAAPGKIYNVTDGSVHTLREIVAAISAALGKPPPRFAIPTALARTLIATAERTAGLVGWRSPLTVATLDKYLEDAPADASRIRQELGFEPQYNLNAGWRETVARLRK